MNNRMHTNDDYGWDICGNSYSRSFRGACDRNGNPVRKTKEEWPYSYSEHVLWGGYKPETGDYSDRLEQWDYGKFNRLWKEHCDCRWSQVQQDALQKFMRDYHSDPELRVTCLVEGCNPSSGYPYWIVYYHRGAEFIRKTNEEVARYKAEAAAEHGK